MGKAPKCPRIFSGREQKKGKKKNRKNGRNKERKRSGIAVDRQNAKKKKKKKKGPAADFVDRRRRVEAGFFRRRKTGRNPSSRVEAGAGKTGLRLLKLPIAQAFPGRRRFRPELKNNANFARAHGRQKVSQKKGRPAGSKQNSPASGSRRIPIKRNIQGRGGGELADACEWDNPFIARRKIQR